MKEISKREQKKIEKLRQENIEKFDESYKQSRIIPNDYKNNIITRVLKNLCIASIAIAYLTLINYLSLNIETKLYINIIKILCVLLAMLSVGYFEISYRNDNGFLFLHGVEFLSLATITLFSRYAYSIYWGSYNKILMGILLAVVIYFVIKTIFTIKNMKNQYYKEQNDIREIIKK